MNSTVRHVSLLFLEVGGTVLCVQEDFILAFSRILSELVGIPLQLVCCFSIYLFFFFSHSCTTMNMMDAPGGKFQLSCLCFWHSVTKNSKSSLGPVLKCFVYLTVFKDFYISFLFRVNEDTITRLFVMFLFYFSKWVVQSYVSTEDFILPFSRILNKLVGIPSYLVRCWYIDIFFLFSFLYNHEYDGHIRK